MIVGECFRGRTVFALGRDEERVIALIIRV